jgi:hypothetical protein
MKKIISTIAIMAITFTGFAQDESSSEYKPSKGSVTTEVGLTGGLGNSGFNLNSGASFSGNPMLKFRYFYKDNVALRIGFSANRSASDSNPSTTTTTTPLPTIPALFTPSTQTFTSGTFFGINVGAEKHFKGSDRLSTFIGADILFGTSKSFSEITNNTAIGSSSTVTNKNANGETYFGLALLTGADYYIAKKVYLGVELGLALIRSKDKDNVVDTSTTVAGVNSTSQVTTAVNGNNFNLQTRLLSGVRLGYQF